jgi:serine/threonine-protein kinase
MESIESGTLIGGKYVVTELLGMGGMGHVYHARHHAVPEFEVAIKILDPELATAVENRERFRHEVLAGYRVNHPHIVRMYEYFDLGTLQAFAMEFADGGTLLDLMSDGPVPIPEGVSFIKQMALALHVLHKAGTYHRDMKPDNVLLTSEGCVKLSDFGVARVRGMIQIDDGGLLAGTPKYVPPEYVENGDSDHRGDIYALGVIAYEMFSGAASFRSETRTSLLKERLQPHGLDLRERAPGIPEELALAIERCLAVDPLQRWSHASDLADAMAAIQRTYALADTVDALSMSSTKIQWSEVLDQFTAGEPNSELREEGA